MTARVYTVRCPHVILMRPPVLTTCCRSITSTLPRASIVGLCSTTRQHPLQVAPGRSPSGHGNCVRACGYMVQVTATALWLS